MLAQEQFEQAEDVDGVRFSWNIFPDTRVESLRTVVPIGSMYTPLKIRDEETVGPVPVAGYDPVVCQTPACQALLNPYCLIDVRLAVWMCPFCQARNRLPAHYANISQDNLPVELNTLLSTMEYVLTKAVQLPPVFLYVVDLCQDDENIDALKETLAELLDLLPPNALVGLVTYGPTVQVHDLSSAGLGRRFVFRGDKQYTMEQLTGMLTGGSANKVAVGYGTALPFLRFFQPVEQAQPLVEGILTALRKDLWKVQLNRRALRCTGSAINVATLLLQANYTGYGGRLMLFAGGPCTIGPGMIVGAELKEAIRLHLDIDKDSAPHYKKAIKFYELVAKRVVANGHIVDIFACCYDQTGISEMRSLCHSTGGVLVLADAFTTFIFKKSFLKVFDRDEEDFLRMAFCGTLEVKTLPHLKVAGMIGHGAPTEKKTLNVLETPIGMGGTSSWKISGLMPQSTYAVFFEVANAQPLAQSVPLYIQYVTTYQHLSGTYRVRVTTVSKPLAPAAEMAITQLFDQEAAAAVMLRVAVFKAEEDDSADVLRWIDRMLIRLCAKYADYQKGDALLFRLLQLFLLYPQFMFYLRRLQFLQIFNNSPDETAFYRHVLNAEDTTNLLTMIQPTLSSFLMDDPTPQPVLLDLVSINPERVLLLDTFFHILIYHGLTIAAWRQEGYAESGDYPDLAVLLSEPKKEVAELLRDRFPLPRFIDCDEGGLQARFLYLRLNPSTTYSKEQNVFGVGGNGNDGVVLTDDVSLQTFMSHLQALAVNGLQS